MRDLLISNYLSILNLLEEKIKITIHVSYNFPRLEISSLNFTRGTVSQNTCISYELRYW